MLTISEESTGEDFVIGAIQYTCTGTGMTPQEGKNDPTETWVARSVRSVDYQPCLNTLLNARLKERGRFPKRRSGRFLCAPWKPCRRLVRRFNGCTVMSPKTRCIASTWRPMRTPSGNTRAEPGSQQIESPPYVG